MLTPFIPHFQHVISNAFSFDMKIQNASAIMANTSGGFIRNKYSKQTRVNQPLPLLLISLSASQQDITVESHSQCTVEVK